MDRNDIFRYGILSQLEDSPKVTNRMITAKLGCSIKLTHELLSDLIHKGFIHVKRHNARRWDYLLTTSGISEKSRLTMEFLDFTFVFYREARKLSSQLCRDLAEAKTRRVAFLGVGQLAEIAYLGVKEWGLDFEGVYDDDGREFLGHEALPFEKLAKSKADAIIVCLYDKKTPMASCYLPPGVESLPKMRWIFNAEAGGGQ